MSRPVVVFTWCVTACACCSCWNGYTSTAESSAEGAQEPQLATFRADITPRVLIGDLNGDGDDDLYFPSTQGTCLVERSFLTHGYARGVILKERHP